MTRREEILRATLDLAAERGLGAVTLSQIAERVGFQDARHFSRVFQKQNGVLPSEYRRIAEESGSPTDK